MQRQPTRRIQGEMDLNDIGEECETQDSQGTLMRNHFYYLMQHSIYYILLMFGNLQPAELLLAWKDHGKYYFRSDQRHIIGRYSLNLDVLNKDGSCIREASSGHENCEMIDLVATTMNLVVNVVISKSQNLMGNTTQYYIYYCKCNNLVHCIYNCLI